VPKYDAFGREIGEDTLEGLGGSPAQPESAWEQRTEREEATWEAAEAVEVARLDAAATAKDAQAERTEDARQQAAGDSRWTAPPTDDAKKRQLAARLSGVLSQAAGGRATGTPTVTVRRSGAARGCLITIVVVLAIGGAALLGILSLVNSVDINTDGIEKAIKAPNAPQIAGPKPKGLEQDSLMRKANVAAALRQLSAMEDAKLTNLRLAPERIDATLLTNEGRLRHVQITPGGKLERFGSDGSPGFDSVPTIPYSGLNPGAPQRLARRGAKEIGVPLTELQYAVPLYSSDQLTWAVYFTRSRYVIGDARGRFDRKYP
jgi:hypothetical protein